MDLTIPCLFTLSHRHCHTASSAKQLRPRRRGNLQTARTSTLHLNVQPCAAAAMSISLFRNKGVTLTSGVPAIAECGTSLSNDYVTNYRNEGARFPSDVLHVR